MVVLLLKGVVLGLEELAFLLVVLDVFCVRMGPVTEDEDDGFGQDARSHGAEKATVKIPAMSSR